MNCQELDVLAYVKGELSEDDKARTKSHVAYCASCSTELERTRGLLRLLQTEEWIQPSPKFVDRVMEAYDADAAVEPIEEPTSLFRQFVNALLGRTKQEGMSWAVSISVHVMLFGFLTLFIATQTVREDEPIIFAPPTMEPSHAPEPINKEIKLPGDQTGVGWRRPPTELPEPWEKLDRSGPTNPKDDLPAQVKRPVRPPPIEEEPRRIYNQVMYETRDMMGAVDAYRKGRSGRDSVFDPKGKVREAVNKAHDWLASKQDANGRWTLVGTSNRTYEVGVTGLVLLSFISEGNSSAQGKHSEVVKKGIDYLIQQQREQGYYGDNKGNWLYNHMIVSMAMLENYHATKDDRDFDASMLKVYKESVHRAIHFIGWAQSETGGWAYEPHQSDTDVHVTAWAVMVLRMAMTAGFRDLAVMPLIKAKAALAKLLLPDDRYAYRLLNAAQFGWQGPTAMGMAAHIFSSFSPDKMRLEKQAEMLSKEELLTSQVEENDKNNLMALYFGAMALHQLQGQPWTEFWKKYSPRLLDSQEKSGAWPVTLDRKDFAQQGGQYYVTAIACLTLQTYNRYPPIN